MKERDVFALVVLLLIFVNIGIALAADLDLEISASLGSFNTSFVAQTSSSASTGFDGYDLISPAAPLPSNYSRFYSSVGSAQLVVDVWPATSNPRILNLAFTTSPTTSGTLGLSWSSPSSSDYVVTLVDYGTDSNYATSVASTNMVTSASYSVSSSGTRYFKLNVTNATSTSDTGGTTTTTTTSGGAGGSGGAAIETIKELIAPIVATYFEEAAVGATQSFKFEGETHKVSIASVSEGIVEIIIQSEPIKIYMKEGDREELDLDNDGVKDIYIEIISVDNGKVKYIISPIETEKNIEVSADEIAINALSGEEIKREVIVKNSGKKKLELNIEIEGLSGLNAPKSLSLEAGEEKTFEFSITPEGKSVLAGKLLLKYGTQTLADIPITINVKSENFLFDVSLIIPRQSKSPEKGDTLKAQINLQQVGAQEKVDVVASYVIKDFEGEKFLEESETFYVIGSKEFTKKFHTDNLPVGKYALGLELVYPGAFASSSAQFEIVRSKGVSSELIILIAVALMAVFAFIAIAWARRTRKKEKRLFRRK